MTALEALALTVDKYGHLAERCSHGAWLRGWNNRTQHDCDVPGCPRTGAPCTKACAAVRAALQAAQPAEGG